MNPLASALNQRAKELNDASPDTGTEWLRALRDRALAKISSGEGNAIVSSTVNGQSHTSQLFLPADKMFEAASDALNGLEEMARFSPVTMTEFPL